ncbi:14300_t:CDS:2 [Funneliformis geosporum]|uniref:11118_t:CDS:1 n=1 Tax=Funneliformis geosporum TaxID=1117311 RepID=A0A9W4SKK5_9GLOM|nr:14300_t:CDS:2 [Funneliformis geosporum]CAI2172014.1 11118_t:CDS:2 [Funneliformis geosporum]
MTCSVERKTLLIWRLFQFWTFLVILVLGMYETSLGNDSAKNDQIRIWVSEAISLSFSGYLLVKLNSRWKDYFLKIDVLIDGFLSVIWLDQSVHNLIAFTNKEMECNNAIKNDTQTKCHLFLGNTTLSFFALSTALIMLILSIVKWKKGRDVTSSTHVHGVHAKSQAYLVRKGSLSNGEPALFFYSKNMHKSPYNNTQRKYMSNSIGVDSTSPVNISIPEPEMVATSKCSRNDYVGLDEEEKGDPALKY